MRLGSAPPCSSVANSSGRGVGKASSAASSGTRGEDARELLIGGALAAWGEVGGEMVPETMRVLAVESPVPV